MVSCISRCRFGIEQLAELFCLCLVGCIGTVLVTEAVNITETDVRFPQLLGGLTLCRPIEAHLSDCGATDSPLHISMRYLSYNVSRKAAGNMCVTSRITLRELCQLPTTWMNNSRSSTTCNGLSTNFLTTCYNSEQLKMETNVTVNESDRSCVTQIKMRLIHCGANSTTSNKTKVEKPQPTSNITTSNSTTPNNTYAAPNISQPEDNSTYNNATDIVNRVSIGDNMELCRPVYFVMTFKDCEPGKEGFVERFINMKRKGSGDCSLVHMNATVICNASNCTSNRKEACVNGMQVEVQYNLHGTVCRPSFVVDIC